jgi:enamine deaminase RidA (YjgF/YER057c/UK114 family)
MSREYFKGEREEQRAYSRAVKLRGGTTVYLAGIGAPTDTQGNSLAGNFTAQTHRVFARLRETMELVGGTLDDIVTMTPDLVLDRLQLGADRLDQQTERW